MVYRLLLGIGVSLLFLALSLAPVVGISSGCFADPSKPECKDASVYYTSTELQDDMLTTCTDRPWYAGCSFWRKCSENKATGTYCEPWNLMSLVCGDPASDGPESCTKYRQLCRAKTATSVVKQCTEAAGVPKFVHTDKAIAAMLRLCQEMPSMQWCSDCTSNQDPSKNCKDALVSLSSLCQDHYMQDCNEWYDMCKAQPQGLEIFCGSSSQTPRDANGDACLGMMQMYFHNGLTDYVLFESWIPCTVGRYVGTLFAILFTGVFTAFLKAVRARIEQRYLASLKAEAEVAVPEGSWGLWPTGQHLRMNFFRCVATFVIGTLDFALMLIAMTYNTGIFFAVIGGVALEEDGSMDSRALTNGVSVNVHSLADVGNTGCHS